MTQPVLLSVFLQILSTLLLVIAILVLAALLLVLTALLIPVGYAAKAEVRDAVPEGTAAPPPSNEATASAQRAVSATASLRYAFLHFELRHAAGRTTQTIALFGWHRTLEGGRKKPAGAEKSKRAREQRKSSRRLRFHRIGRAFLRALRHDLAAAWRILRPSGFGVTGRFSLEDPADTAEVAMLAMAAGLAWPQAEIALWPAFDGSPTDVTAWIHGRFVPIVLVFRALRFMFRKEVRQVIFHRPAKASA